MRISPDRSELLSESKNDLLVDGSGTARSRILMLRNSCNFRVDSGFGAENASQSNLASVSLQSSEDQSISLTCHIPSCLCVGESLIGGSLVETVQVGNLSSTGRGGCVTEKTEDGVLNLVGVIEVQVDTDPIKKSVVRVFLGDFTGHHSPCEGECDDILCSRSGCCSCESEEDSNDR